MGFQADIAEAILDTLKTCVTCEKYDRQMVTLGDPAIDCSTLAVAINEFPPAAQVANCAIHELRMNVVIAQCCYPLPDNAGNPPSPDAITAASRCVLDDVERALCCLYAVSFDIPGAVKQCKPTIFAPRYSRPQGGCVVAKIELRIPGVPVV